MVLLFYNNTLLFSPLFPLSPLFHCVTHGHVTGATLYCTIVTSSTRDRCHALLRNRDVINSWQVPHPIAQSWRHQLVPRLCCVDVVLRLLRYPFVLRFICVGVAFMQRLLRVRSKTVPRLLRDRSTRFMFLQRSSTVRCEWSAVESFALVQDLFFSLKYFW